MLRESVAKLSKEAAELRASVHASEKASCRSSAPRKPNWAGKSRHWRKRLRAWKEDLAFFENLIPSENRDNTLLINRFRVDPGALPGSFTIACCCCRGQARQAFPGESAAVGDPTG